MELAEVEGEDLLDVENMRVSSLLNLEGDFVVRLGNNFVCDKPLFELKLSSALSVETKEAGGEEDTVLEVALDLSLNGVTDESFLVLVGNYHAAKMTRSISG